MSKATNTAKASAKKKAEPDTAAAVDEGFGDLDKVRSILFGTQSRQFQQRFEWMEEHFERKMETLKETVEDRFVALEKHIKKEDTALSKRLMVEQQQRAEAEAGLEEAVQAVAHALEVNRAQLDETISETERALQKRIDNEASKAQKDRTRRFDDLSARLEQAVADLTDQKTDRLALADLFDHLSAQLRNDQQADEEA
ncbi:MAG: hypothetical protein ACE5G0_15420 [Rhodothermales bacterium]